MNNFLFIDGSNLYAGQYELFGPDKYLNFLKFIYQIESTLSLHFDTIFFYASYSPRPEVLSLEIKKYLTNEALFYKGVRELSNLVFFKGYRSPTSGKEKEVDVKLTVDLMRNAYENKFDCVYLMTGDADFLQVLLAIIDLKKDINLLCINNKIMFKGSYYFKTFIINFLPQEKKVLFHSKQKIITFDILKSDVEVCINKKPPDASI